MKVQLDTEVESGRDRGAVPCLQHSSGGCLDLGSALEPTFLSSRDMNSSGSANLKDGRYRPRGIALNRHVEL